MTEDLSLSRILVRPWLLLVLAERPGHGYDVADRLRSLGFDWSGQGPVYKHLRDLEHAELLRSRLDTPGGPARRTYELTDNGHQALASCAQDVRLLSGVVDQFLERHQRVAASRVP